jgi:hypothetical protein
VHFDGSTWLEHESLVATDNHFYSFVGWLKVTEENAAASNTIFVTDPDVNYSPWMELRTDDGQPATYQVETSISDASGNNYEYETSTIGPSQIPADTWACIIGCFDSSTSFGVGKVYCGDVDITGIFPSAHAGSVPFNIASNGKPWYFGSDSFGDNLIGDVADWRLMPGTNLLTGGDIALATRRLFIDENGKPVDPAIATTALGTPCILYSGDSDTFSTNQGTGGTTVVTGTLTNASTSPSD